MEIGNKKLILPIRLIMNQLYAYPSLFLGITDPLKALLNERLIHDRKVLFYDPTHYESAGGSQNGLQGR